MTQQGPPSQESGRVTAIAVDPACAPGDCRVWVAAAGGGIWRTGDALALHPQWTAPPDDVPTTAFGSLYYDAPRETLYAGSGEPNGSSDSEAGLGLFKSTDGGASWTLVPGSAAVATNRSIGAIAIDPRTANTIYIGTAVARHGSSSSNGGRRTPPGAPALGVYKSTDGGASFARETDLSDRTPANPTDPATGNDWFQGGITRLELDPNDPDAVYAGVLGYGVWRSADAGSTWGQVFHTINQSDFSDPANPAGDFFGDITQFDLVDLGATTRAYLGDASDDFALDEDPSTPLPEVYRNDDVAAIVASPNGDHANADWTKLSSEVNGTNGFAAYGWCQNGQCGYDSYVVSPPGHPDEVWLGGSMNYDELPAYAGQPPRSNGRAVIRSTNADGTAAMYAATHGRGAFTLRLPARPTVAIAGPSELRVGEPVTYGATGNASDGGPLTFAWQLPGNPPTASGSSASFTPTTPGQATVRVTATDSRGLANSAAKAVTISPASPTSTPTPTPTPTPGDHKRPTLKVSKIKAVRRPKATIIKGRATDKSGIRRVTIRFGDGKRKTSVHLSRSGRFTVRPRYGKPARYEVTVIATDRAGNTSTKHLTARVLAKRRPR